jgi:hypothetical protein
MPRYTRTNDPITSHLAGESVTEETLTRIQKLVEQIFSHSLELTDEELVSVYTKNGYPGTPQAVRTARAELGRLGRIEVVGFGKTVSGRKARIWARV